MDVNEAAPSTQEQPAVASAHLSKEAALEACLEQHSAFGSQLELGIVHHGRSVIRSRDWRSLNVQAH